MSYLSRYSDKALADLYDDVSRERERRQRLAQVPGQIAAMTEEYVAAGGDRSKIEEAVAVKPEPTPETPLEGFPEVDLEDDVLDR